MTLLDGCLSLYLMLGAACAICREGKRGFLVVVLFWPFVALYDAFRPE